MINKKNKVKNVSKKISKCKSGCKPKTHKIQYRDLSLNSSYINK